MIRSKCQLLNPATELTQLGLTRTNCFIRCVDMVHKRRSESDDSIIYSRTSNLMHFKLFFVVLPFDINVRICVTMAKMVVDKL